MFQQTIRKHRALFGILVFGPIILTFILWGGDCGRQGGPEDVDKRIGPVATVGGIPIQPSELKNSLDYVVDQQQKSAEPEDLLADGTVDRVLEDLADRIVLMQLVTDRNYRFDRDFLVEQLKKEFVDDQGNFDREGWNRWVESGTNWNTYYDQVALAMAQQVVVAELGASARILEKDVRKQFEEQQLKVKVKYAAIEPAVVPTEEQIQKRYEENKEQYAVPAQYQAEYAAVSLQPQAPDKLTEIVEQARGGADFAELAREFSIGPNKDDGGDLGWKAAGDPVAPHVEVIFGLAAGQVSSPVYGPGGYYVYKVMEERTSELTEEREVRASEIFMPASLTEEERQERLEKAQAVRQKATEGVSLADAAQGASLATETTGLFSTDSTEIDGIPQNDIYAFRSAVTKLEAGALTDVITASRNLYVAKVTNIVPPVDRPLEEVREEVVEDVINAQKMTPEYRTEMATLAQEMSEKAKSLDELKSLYPDMNIEIRESSEFSLRDYAFDPNFVYNPGAVIQAVSGKEPGEFTGPIYDYSGKVFFVELVSKQLPPEDELKQKWEEDAPQLLQQARMYSQSQRIEDHLRHLRQREGYHVNTAALFDALGIQPGGPSEGEGAAPATPPEGEAALPVEGEGGDEATAEAPAADEAVVEAPAPEEQPAAEEAPVAEEVAPVEETPAPETEETPAE